MEDLEEEEEDKGGWGKEEEPPPGGWNGVDDPFIIPLVVVLWSPSTWSCLSGERGGSLVVVLSFWSPRDLLNKSALLVSTAENLSTGPNTECGITFPSNPLVTLYWKI